MNKIINLIVQILVKLFSVEVVKAPTLPAIPLPVTPPADNPPPVPQPAPKETNPYAIPNPSHAWGEYPLYLKNQLKAEATRICQDLGMMQEKIDELFSIIQCESGWNPYCIHPNLKDGKLESTDYGVCQINDYWHIGSGKDFPSADFVINNPLICLKWMAKMDIAGKLDLWVCYSTGLYLKDMPKGANQNK